MPRYYASRFLLTVCFYQWMISMWDVVYFSNLSSNTFEQTQLQFGLIIEPVQLFCWLRISLIYYDDLWPYFYSCFHCLVFVCVMSYRMIQYWWETIDDFKDLCFYYNYNWITIMLKMKIDKVMKRIVNKSTVA